MKYAITTLGCKVNQFETQAIEAMLRERGHEPAEITDADVLIVNTCAVTGESGRKSRQAARRLRKENPGARLVICGCYSHIFPEECAELDADLLRGSGDRTGLVEDIERIAVYDNIMINKGDNRSENEFEELPAGAIRGRVRAMLKIEDGCDNYCAYCVIPYARGRVRSLRADKAVKQAVRIYNRGFRELVITGIEISSYGKDLGEGPDLAGLIKLLAEAVPELRLRLGSLEPTMVTDSFCEALLEAGTVCAHFHLSLQSGCDETLGRMGRKYDTKRFYDSVQRLRDSYPGCALTADLITGFPGETLEEHLKTLRFIEKCGFSSMHIFPFSARAGTRAALMSGQLGNREKLRRAHELQDLAKEMGSKYLEKQKGRVLPVLFEIQEDGWWQGHADNYTLVAAKGDKLRGLVKNVGIEDVKSGKLVGKIV